jgi:hypothetical protein
VDTSGNVIVVFSASLPINQNNLKEGHEIARKKLNAAAKRQKMTYDVKVRPVTYKVGDLVWRNQKRNAPGLNHI